MATGWLLFSKRPAKKIAYHGLANSSSAIELCLPSFRGDAHMVEHYQNSTPPKPLGPLIDCYYDVIRKISIPTYAGGYLWRPENVLHLFIPSATLKSECVEYRICLEYRSASSTIPLHSPSATQEAGNALVTPLRWRMFMDGVDHLHFSGWRARLLFDIVIRLTLYLSSMVHATIAMGHNLMVPGYVRTRHERRQPRVKRKPV
ncbi:hypothetical protein EVAR_58979_1 [Eumeta japonica]|uniref:Uncharacterized protein n=1 Tax=Eumeta variegata TaxID=151549 RepID=A0A4C1YEM2_EUMVA|nr:hypothetical protein EVAR_58979_1 [Eumeta japonica]